jgi:hypothetical protein
MNTFSLYYYCVICDSDSFVEIQYIRIIKHNETLWFDANEFFPLFLGGGGRGVRVCWPLHSFAFVVHSCIIVRCLDSNPESCRSKLASYQLTHPSPY